MKCFLTHQRQQTTKQTNLSSFLLRYKSPQVVKQISSPIQTMVWECQKQCHDTTLRSQNAEQLRENGWLRCSRKPQSFKTYDSSESGVWSSYTVREAYKPLNLRKTTLRTLIAICLLDRYGNTVKHNFDVSHCNARVAKLKSG